MMQPGLFLIQMKAIEAEAIEADNERNQIKDARSGIRGGDAIAPEGYAQA